MIKKKKKFYYPSIFSKRSRCFVLLSFLLCGFAFIVTSALADSRYPLLPDNTDISNPVAVSTVQWQTVNMRVTAYCPCSKCCGQFSDGVTANGHKINHGDRFAAADKRFPFQTDLIIPGYNTDKPVKVLDRGGAIQGNRLDVFFNTHDEALAWGVQYLDVKISVN
ncbi:MAG: 3D domain-containing protein [Planctomycetota bacterium]|jgi:3D (Asp-Asp-Asp) domain-containing protein